MKLILLIFIGVFGSYIFSYADDNVINESEKAIIEEFKKICITNDMTDFEKEMAIIRYIVGTTTYDYENLKNNTVPKEDFASEGALIYKKAVCDGYSKAFMKLSEACGLNVKRVTGQAYNYGAWVDHSWNQICLDGNWYNVDVTWEDPVPDYADYGFNTLRNQYINLTDFELSSKNHIWSSAETCTSAKYGQKTVSFYLATGVIKENVSDDDVLIAAINSFKLDESKIGAHYTYSATEGEVSLFNNSKFSDNKNLFINNGKSLSDNEKVKLRSYIDLAIEMKQKIIPIIFTEKGIDAKYLITSGINDKLLDQTKYYTIHIDDKNKLDKIYGDQWFICYKG